MYEFLFSDYQFKYNYYVTNGRKLKDYAPFADAWKKLIDFVAYKE